MSKSNSPAHYFFNTVGDHYDPEFTKEISSKMLVPDRISVVGENSAQLSERSYLLSDQEKLIMNVPERILVAGGDKHIGGREPLPELRLESNIMLHSLPAVQLSTPPHVITLDEHHYPTINEIPPESKLKSVQSLTNADITLNDQEHQSSQGTNSTEISPHSPEEELAILRKQVKHLSRRVLTIEQDNQQRQQREIAVYSLGIIYFLLKGLIWLHKNW